jgi:hypothetical protein
MVVLIFAALWMMVLRFALLIAFADRLAGSVTG